MRAIEQWLAPTADSALPIISSHNLMNKSYVMYNWGERERATHMLVEVVRACVFACMRAVLVSRIPYVQIIHLLIIILN